MWCPSAINVWEGQLDEKIYLEICNSGTMAIPSAFSGGILLPSIFKQAELMLSMATWKTHSKIRIHFINVYSI